MTYKFRAWDHLLKQWICVGYAAIGETTLFGLVEAYLEENRQGATSMLERLGDVEETMWSGVIDKNGIDLYAGDKVKWTRKVREVFTGTWKWQTDEGVIVWRERGFWVDKEGFGWEGEDLWNWDEIEYSGNIFEHDKI